MHYAAKIQNYINARLSLFLNLIRSDVGKY